MLHVTRCSFCPACSAHTRALAIALAQTLALAQHMALALARAPAPDLAGPLAPAAVRARALVLA
eukprot:9875047-Lingulodinium_polyedra.AAC.1